METMEAKRDCRNCSQGEEVCPGKFVCRMMETIMGKPITLYDGSTTPSYASCGGKKWIKK